MVVYLHKRLNDNEVFYVGIGSNKRAYSSNSRNKHWKDVVSAHGFCTEITHENIIREEACSIEKYLIEFYKEHSKCKMTNKTNGGDGADREMAIELNKIRWSDPKQKEKLRISNKIRWSDPKEKVKLSERNKIRFADKKEREKISNTNVKRFSEPKERENNSQKMKIFWSNLSEERKDEIRNKMKKPKNKIYVS